ncbi:PKD domain-containing protein [Mucilaginibacter conchicola]|uniref:PKD domain-containing protein n=1 Tax=Mucilaginibacter conchicola TaxID=2303333 RepID=A0A372NW43_9SPHI|nr:PKD domain-containing protein [Mucilaginibacter conchicola]
MSGIRAAAQVTSNAGNEFWTAFPTHVPDVNPDGSAALAKFSIFITSNQASSGTVTAGSFTQHFTVAANGVTEILVPRPGIYIEDAEGNRVLPGRGIHITTDAGQPAIVVYTHIYAAQRSAAALLLPVNALGQKYYSMNYAQHRLGKNFMLLVATEPDTRIRIITPFGDYIPGGILLANPGDVYELLNDVTLTGWIAVVDDQTSACKHFAMFSGSSGLAAGVDCDFTGTVDPLFQQTLPPESWGYTYGFVPFSTASPNFANPVRTAGQRVTVIAKEDNTVLRIGGTIITTLNAGGVYTTYRPLKEAALIQASKPVEVAQFAFSQDCSMDPRMADEDRSYSDPDMVILNPAEYRIKDITLFSSNKEHIQEQYINVFMKSAATASFRINGQLPAQPFKPVGGAPEYAYLQLLVDSTQRTFHLQADDGFNAVAYGFGKWESYAYAAGTNLGSSQSLMAVRTTTGETIDSACVDDQYKFRLSLPFPASSITWQADPSETAETINTPVPVMTDLNGVPVYNYDLQKTPALGNAGTHHLKAIAAYPTTMGGCSNGSQTIEADFKVLALPVPDFSYAPDACTSGTNFTDRTPATDRISSWIWDFGDPASGAGNSSAVRNPVHQFSSAGTFQVRLTTTSAAGCTATKTRTVQITKAVYPGFEAPAVACPGKETVLSDTSRSTTFIIKSRVWIFGDGTRSLPLEETSVSHRYNGPGSYTVRMVLINTAGCTSDTVSRNIRVTAPAIAGFEASLTCTEDPFTVFTDKSTGEGLRYRWDFGDGQSLPQNNYSGEASPKHHYSRSGNYTVKLIVTGEAGCSDTVSHMVTVSSSRIRASFSPLQENGICEGQPLQVRDLSAVQDFGSVRRLVWVKDALNKPAEREVIDQPAEGRIYQFSYPVSGTTQQYRLRLIAYAGGICADSTEQTITVYAKPHATFAQLQPVCIDAAPFSLAGGAENSGEPGTGIYKGIGVSTAGLFDAATAGTGVHELFYIFTNMAGCADTARQTILVRSAPKAPGTTSYSISAGQSVRLNPGGTEPGITYSWTPLEGLSSGNVANPVASPGKTTVYNYHITDGYCDTYGSITVNVRLLIEINNSFSPNGDGINDLLNIKHMEDYPGADLRICTRWGTEVFHLRANSGAWDGTWKGKLLPTGVYYYVITVPGYPNQSGNITLLR